MTENNKTEIFNTVVSADNTANVSDYQELRADFHIYPGEDGMKYSQLKLLGMGGVGVVYSAEDPTLERRVALKVLREPLRHDRKHIGKFINEARTTAKIDHPNVISVHQLGLNENYGVYFSMRKISGETLQSAIRSLQSGDPEAKKRYTIRRLIDIFIAGCNGVAAAHAKNILHCDLKPANIMIGNCGEVIVMDWGLAREFDSTPAEEDKIISGTLAYMAPELLCGEIRVPDEKTEVYALGTILFSILTRQPAPFDLDLAKEQLVELVVSGKTLPLRAPKGEILNPELAAICRKAMSLDRNERYASVFELLEDLNNYRDDYPVLAYSPNIFYRFFKLCCRRPVIPITVIAAVLTLLIYNEMVSFDNYVRDRAFFSFADISLQSVGENYKRNIYRHRMMFDPSSEMTVLNIALENKKIIMQSNQVLAEYRSIIDSAAGLSSAGQKKFAEQYAAGIFKKMLDLYMIQGDIEGVRNFVRRYGDREIFLIACRRDGELNERIQMIKNDCGSINLIQQNNSVTRRGYIQLPSGEHRNFEINGELLLELPSGENYLYFEDGLRAKFRVIPGNREIIWLPESPEDENFVAVPSDHFFMKLPEIDEFFCCVNDFEVRREPLPGEFTHQEAEQLLQNKYAGKQWRLPHLMEVHKILKDSASDGKGFYGTDFPHEGYLLLANGLFYDLKRCRMVSEVPAGRAKLLPAKSSGDIKLIRVEK